MGPEAPPSGGGVQTLGEPGAAGVGAPRPVTPHAILAERLEALVRRAEGDASTDPALRDELRAARDLAAGLDPYVAAMTTPASGDLDALAHASAAHDWDAPADHDARGGGAGAPAPATGAHVALEQEMLSGHVEGQLLRMLVGAVRARRVLEVGMFTGYSALAMAQALPDDGEVVACELDPRAIAVAREAFAATPAGARVRIEPGPAAATLDRLAEAGERFDVVFVDADKAGYAGYVSTVLDRGLLAADGLLLVDNTLMQGLPWGAGTPTANGEAIARFNADLAADPRVEQVLVPLRDGLTLARRA